MELEGRKASSVKVIDKLQNSITVSAEYLNLPHKCHLCSEYGHSEQRCPGKSSFLLRNAPPSKIADPPQASPKESSAHKEESVASKSPAASKPDGTQKKLTPPAEDSSSRGSSATVPSQARPPLRKSSSLPSIRANSSSSSKQSGHQEWILVGTKSPQKQPPPKPPIDGTINALSSSHFDSEEEIISAAQLIIRKRLEAADADFPPFSTAKEKRKIRKHTRQAMSQLCDGPFEDASTSNDILKSASHIPLVTVVESSVKGLAPVFPDA